VRLTKLHSYTTALKSDHQPVEKDGRVLTRDGKGDGTTIEEYYYHDVGYKQIQKIHSTDGR
jgi:hypothetical protein